MSASNDKNTPEVCTFAYFLESVPPGSKWAISDLFHRRYTGIVLLPQRPSAASAPSWSLNTPDIWLHCPTKKCSGDRAFACLDDVSDVRGYQQMNIFLVYSCRNCSKSTKTYSLRVTAEGEGSDSAVKYGEMPAFGPPLPAHLLNMVGADGALLRKGRQTENQSLGIGAFAYYRRVVENQKNRLLEDIRKAAERLDADEELLSSIDLAMKEARFSEALKLVKDAIPDGLKVDGHNPLTLLHDALSKGVHELSDEECLERAQVVRGVLDRLVSNIARVTKDESEFDAAVSKLLSQD